MKVHDITLPVTQRMVTWPGGPRPSHRWIARVAHGDPCNESVWTLGAHTGTHVDAPSHFIDGGGDMEGVEVDRLVGPARVFDLSAHDGPLIGRAQLDGLDLDGVTRALFKTSNSDGRLGSDAYDTGFCSIGADAAEALVAAGVRTVGIDYLSVERFVPDDEKDYGDPVHHTLLGARLALLEGIDLRGVEAGDYLLCALPLKLVGAEAAPARAVLIEAPGLAG